MTLKVEEFLALDRADLFYFVGAELIKPGLEGVDPVEVGPVIDPGPLVPQGAIGVEVLIHAAAMVGILYLR